MRQIKVNEDVAERRRREDESPRLREILPRLQTLQLELSESRREGSLDFSHVKRIVVEHAPSVFLIPCGEPRCKHGSYDLTSQLLPGLRRGDARIEASDTCQGDIGSSRCGRTLTCVAIAVHAPLPA